MRQKDAEAREEYEKQKKRQSKNPSKQEKNPKKSVPYWWQGTQSRAYAVIG